MRTSSYERIAGLSAIACLAIVASAGAGAQPRDSAEPAASKTEIAPMPLADWTYDRVYEGWYADSVIDRAIYDPHGNEIGNVKNLLLSTRGEVVALIAEVGGFWDIADTHVAVPWDEVELRDGKVYSPITEETAENYGLFAEEYYTSQDIGDLGAVEEFFATGPYLWKATALLDDYVVLENGDPFGYVTDLVFDDDGKLISVVAVYARGDLDRRGVYALPWDDRDWRPRFDHYTLRHTLEEIEQLPKIDYSEFDRDS
jgi:sporulation protein YlmC with PRC-barrel domain